MPRDTYAFEADVLESRKLNMVGMKQRRRILGGFYASNGNLSLW